MLKEGKNKHIQLFLFNDILLYARLKGTTFFGHKQTLRYKGTIEIENAIVTGIPDSREIKNGFQISSFNKDKNQKMIFIAHSKEDKEQWMEEIQKAIDELHNADSSKRLSLRSGLGSAPSTPSERSKKRKSLTSALTTMGIAGLVGRDKEKDEKEPEKHPKSRSNSSTPPPSHVRNIKTKKKDNFFLFSPFHDCSSEFFLLNRNWAVRCLLMMRKPSLGR
jgi:hypothetical protein